MIRFSLIFSRQIKEQLFDIPIEQRRYQFAGQTSKIQDRFFPWTRCSLEHFFCNKIQH
ncbi:GSCOCG00009612001-RA-CDS [Cotesia congregata]|nr:GSCOCG00009612001-RA-CDS [Cotesia congregata]